MYSNRSGAYASLKNFEKALEDANKTTELKADWVKGWGRKGAAMHGLGDLSMSAGYDPFLFCFFLLFPRLVVANEKPSWCK